MRRARLGFSLVEVLIASAVISSALLAILGAVSVIFKSSRNTGVVMTAALLATERLDYFQGQTNPYIAAGGTWYPAPFRRNELDMNQVQDLHNRFQRIADVTPYLFVREWLYDTTEKRYSDNSAVPDQGRRGQAGRSTGAAVNVIPPTPVFFPAPPDPNSRPVSGVFPNLNNPPNLADVSVPNNWETNTYRFIPAPRANAVDPFTGANIGNGSALPPSIRYMREVWVQTNQPELTNAPVGCPWAGLTGPTEFPLVTYPAGSLWRPAAVGANSVPPWVATVTVRVFARDPLCRTWNRNGPVLDGSTAATAYTPANRVNSMGYDPRRPLAVVTGYFGLRRTM